MSNISFNPLAWAIKPLYDKAIAEDALFAKEVREKEARAEKPKSLDECADYILGEAYDWASKHRNGKVGYSGLPDDEMISLIKHYYDEDNIKIKSVTGATASVSKAGGTDAKTTAKAKKPENKVVPMTGLFASQSASAPAKPKDKSNTYDLFAGLWGDDEKKEEKKIDKVDVEEIEDDDDLPM